MNDRRVFVTGIGTVSPYGVGVDTYWENISAGKSAAVEISSFEVSTLPTRFAAQLQFTDTNLDRLVTNQKSLKTLSRSGKMAVIAAQEAVTDSQIESSDINPRRFGTCMGAGGVGFWDADHSDQLLEILGNAINTDGKFKIDHSRAWQNVYHNVHPLTPLKALSNIPTAHIAILFNARGNCQTITTACTSSAQAIGDAYRQIKFGFADAVIAGGSDAMINPYGLVAFSTLGVMSKNNDEWQTAARPFDRRRDGFMLGEGAAAVILEDAEYCLRRGGTPYAEIIGFSNTCDAFRLTDEPPDARGAIAAIEGALEDAGIKPDAIDYINSHGTGTRLNDKSETLAIKSVFGRRCYDIPVSSTKSMIGHLVAGAGGIEFVACILAMKHHIIPPTINYVEPDESCDLDYVPNLARESLMNVILSNSFGFGGQNACLIIRKCD